MRELKLKPKLQIWVCVNERSQKELPSCTQIRGNEIFNSLQQELLKRPAEKRQEVWINRTLCQGSCNPNGVSLVIEFHDTNRPGRRFAAVTPEDISKLLDEIL